MVGAVTLAVMTLIVLDARSLLDKTTSKVVSSIILAVILCLIVFKASMIVRREWFARTQTNTPDEYAQLL